MPAKWLVLPASPAPDLLELALDPGGTRRVCERQPDGRPGTHGREPHVGGLIDMGNSYHVPVIGNRAPGALSP